jgi:hypothetical protein
VRKSARPGHRQLENTRTHDLTLSTHLPFLGVAAGRHGHATAVLHLPQLAHLLSVLPVQQPHGESGDSAAIPQYGGNAGVEIP